MVKQSARRSLSEKEDELARLTAENAELQALLADQAASASVAERQHRVESLNAQLVKVKTQLDSIESERAQLRAQLESAMAERERTQSKLTKANAVAQSLEDELVASTEEAAQLEAHLRELEAELATPLPTRGESETARRLYMNLATVRQEQEKLRGQLATAKNDCDVKRAQLVELHAKLRRSAGVLAQRDAQLADAQRRSADALQHALDAAKANPDSVSRVHDAMAVSDSKDVQIEILTAKARDTDAITLDLLEFLKSCAPQRVSAYQQEIPVPQRTAGPRMVQKAYEPSTMYSLPASARAPPSAAGTYASGNGPSTYASAASSSAAPQPRYAPVKEENWQDKAAELDAQLASLKAQQQQQQYGR